MKLRRRETEMFSLSFLDCICCGFGAIILLLVLTEVDQPVIIERASVAMNGQLLRLQQELFEIRGETDQLNRELQGRINTLSAERARLSRAQGDLTNVKGEFAASRSDAAVANIVQSELVSAYQELTAEMDRLLKQPQRHASAASVGGIPVDSEYVVFVIDTSNSMVSMHWDAALQIMRETLDIYPDVKGLQVMNDQGKYMFENTRGHWLTDSSQTRDRIRSALGHLATLQRIQPGARHRTGVARAPRRGRPHQHLCGGRRIHRRIHPAGAGRHQAAQCRGSATRAGANPRHRVSRRRGHAAVYKHPLCGANAGGGREQ